MTSRQTGVGRRLPAVLSCRLRPVSTLAPADGRWLCCRCRVRRYTAIEQMTIASISATEATKAANTSSGFTSCSDVTTASHTHTHTHTHTCHVYYRYHSVTRPILHSGLLKIKCIWQKCIRESWSMSLMRHCKPIPNMTLLSIILEKLTLLNDLIESAKCRHKLIFITTNMQDRPIHTQFTFSFHWHYSFILNSAAMRQTQLVDAWCNISVLSTQ